MRYLLTLAMMALSFAVAHAQNAKLVADIDRLYAARFRAEGPGCAVLVARGGEVIYRKAFGMANLEHQVRMVPENVFRIASLTKQFTGVAILQLHEQGRLNLDDDIRKYIPDFPSPEPITIAHLASHTSGIRNTYEAVVPAGITRKSSTPAELVEMIKGFPSDFKPGKSFRYSNSGYVLLGYIVEKVSGLPYQQYITENIFKPLGMNRACYDNHRTVVPGRASGYASSGDMIVNADFLDQSFPFAAGALMMSVDDMYKWNKGLHTFSIITKATLDKALMPFTLADGSKADYGFGWGISSIMGTRAWQHSGGIEGFSTYAVYLPDEDVFAVAFANIERIDVTTPTMIAATMAAGKLSQTTVPERVADRYLGTYRFPDGHEAHIYKEKGKLLLKDTNSPVPWQMHFTDERSFYCEEVFPNLHVFTFDKSDNVDSFVIRFGGGEVRIEKVK